MIQMNLFTKQKETPTYKMNLWLPGKGYLGSLRRSRIHAVFIALGAYCVAPGTLRSAVWQQGWEGGRGKKGHMYIYGCVPLLSTWNHHSIGNLCVCVCVCSVAQSRSTFCSPMDCSLPGSSVHGIFQACWSGPPFPPRGGLPDPGSTPALLHHSHWQVDSWSPHHLGSPVNWLHPNTEQKAQKKKEIKEKQRECLFFSG